MRKNITHVHSDLWILPEAGSIYEDLKGNQRKVLRVTNVDGERTSSYAENFDVIWCRPKNPNKEYRIWFKYWRRWQAHAMRIK